MATSRAKRNPAVTGSPVDAGAQIGVQLGAQSSEEAVRRRLTPAEREERKRRVEEWADIRRNDPEQVARIAWIKSVFQNDFDKIGDFAADLMRLQQQVVKENEELVAKLNHIYAVAGGISSTNVAPYIKRNIARFTLEHDPAEPVSLAFLAGMNAQKSLQAAQNALKSHTENHAARAQVFAWCDLMMSGFSSMNKAAEAVAHKFVPYPYPTVRGWMTMWKKEKAMAASADSGSPGRMRPGSTKG